MAKKKRRLITRIVRWLVLLLLLGVVALLLWAVWIPKLFFYFTSTYDIYTATQIKTLLNAMNTQCLFGTNPLIGDCTQRNRHNECQQKHHSAFHLHLFSPSFHAVFLRKKGMNLSLFSVSGRIHAPLFRLSQNLF